MYICIYYIHTLTFIFRDLWRTVVYSSLTHSTLYHDDKIVSYSDSSFTSAAALLSSTSLCTFTAALNIISQGGRVGQCFKKKSRQELHASNTLSKCWVEKNKQGNSSVTVVNIPFEKDTESAPLVTQGRRLWTVSMYLCTVRVVSYAEQQENLSPSSFLYFSVPRLNLVWPLRRKVDGRGQWSRPEWLNWEENIWQWSSLKSFSTWSSQAHRLRNKGCQGDERECWMMPCSSYQPIPLSLYQSCQIPTGALL